MGDQTILQEDFSGGISGGRRAPPNTVYDAVNALISDEGQLYRRGGDVYYSSADTTPAFVNVGAYFMPAVRATRVFGWNDFTASPLSLTLAPVFLGLGAAPDRRPVQIGNFLVWPNDTSASYALYGGTLSTASYSAGTATFTAGSKTVTGAGTAWVANVTPGMIIAPGATSRQGVVTNVGNDTTLTLMDPWPTTTFTAAAYNASIVSSTSFATIDRGVGTHVAAAGSGAPRLVFMTSNRAYLSDVNDPTTLSANVNQFLEFPAGSLILGGEGYGDSCFIFTDSGVWRADNLSLDAIDDLGNVQWQQERINGALILWGENGIASWRGATIVPGTDDVHLMAADGTTESLSGDPSNGKIRKQYRSYVKAGYLPGTAAVWNGHYVLPIYQKSGNTGTPIDTLICRLDRGAVWTRWAGHAAGTGFAVLPGQPSKLLAATGARISDTSGCFSLTGGTTRDADLTTPTFTVDSNDFDLGPGIRPNTVEKVRYVYETAGGTPTFTFASAVGAEGASYTNGTLKRGGGASDGTDYTAVRINRKAERMRFRFRTSSQLTSLILRRLELTVRPAGQS
jgi:hypothetical protein